METLDLRDSTVAEIFKRAEEAPEGTSLVLDARQVRAVMMELAVSGGGLGKAVWTKADPALAFKGPIAIDFDGKQAGYRGTLHEKPIYEAYWKEREVRV